VELAKSTLVPKEYQGNAPNCLIALEYAMRTGFSPMMVMQNLYIVHGRPGWSSQFIIAAMNSCGRFKPLQFDVSGEGDARGCVAWTEDKDGRRVESIKIDIIMAKKEGWYNKAGSKWQTMPEQMLRYRSASFLGRIYAPDILMGLQTVDELEDMQDVTPPKSALSDAIKLAKVKAVDDKMEPEVESEVELEPEPLIVTVQPAYPDLYLISPDGGESIKLGKNGLAEADLISLLKSWDVKQKETFLTLNELILNQLCDRLRGVGFAKVAASLEAGLATMLKDGCL
jgi:hypothetical protein